MSNPYQPQDPNNPYGSQPEHNYQQPYSGPTQALGGQPPYGQPPVNYSQPPYGQPPYGQPPVAYGGYYTPVAMVAQRPTGVSIIAILQYIIAGMFGLITLVVLFAGSELDEIFDGSVGGLAIVIALVLVLFVALFISLGLGLWRMRSWAHITTIIIYSILIALNVLLALGGELETSDLVRVIIEIAIVVYLALPATRAAFRR